MINAVGIPGENATAGMVMVTEEIPALVFYMDQGNYSIQLPPVPYGPQVMARLCREIAEEAAKLAEHLEAKYDLATGKHHLEPSWFSDSGPGGLVLPE